MNRITQYIFIITILTAITGGYFYFQSNAAVTIKTGSIDSLVGYWDFEEGSGGTVNDRSGNNYSGTITGAAYTDGVLGGALDFGGSDYVSVSSGINFALNDPFSVCAWFKYDSGTGTNMITAKNNSEEGYGLLQADRTNGRVFWAAIRDAGDFAFRGRSASGGITANTWNFACGTYDGSDTISGVTLYVNGVEDFTVTHNYPEFTDGFAISDPFLIGGNNGAGSFDGSIDEVKVYNRVLSSAEVTNFYQEKKNKVNASQDSKLTDGLVGYWTLDGNDTTWSDASTGTVTDKSGSGYTGTLINMSQSTDPQIGKIGQGLYFDGNNAIEFGDIMDFNIDDSFSTSFWVNFKSFTSNGYLMGKWGWGCGNGWYISFHPSTAKISFAFDDSVCDVQPSVTESASASLNTWYHYVVTYDGVTKNGTIFRDSALSQTGSMVGVDTILNNLSFTVGARSGPSYSLNTGKMDEVRVYNRVLATSEITELYNQGQVKINASQEGKLTNGLVGYWSFDGNHMDWSATNAEVRDQSGNNNHGDASTYGVDNSNAIIGKIGQALDFDGAGEYVEVSDSGSSSLDISGAVTMAGWIRVNSFPASAISGLLGKGLAAGPGNRTGYSLFIDDNSNCIDSDGNPDLAYTYGSTKWGCTSVELNIGQWYHLAVTHNGSNAAQIYVDGQFIETVSDSSTQTIDDVSFTIGKNGVGISTTDADFDEIRIYNRELSASEITELYDMGR